AWSRIRRSDLVVVSLRARSRPRDSDGARLSLAAAPEVLLPSSSTSGHRSSSPPVADDDAIVRCRCEDRKICNAVVTVRTQFLCAAEMKGTAGDLSDELAADGWRSVRWDGAVAARARDRRCPDCARSVFAGAAVPDGHVTTARAWLARIDQSGRPLAVGDRLSGERRGDERVGPASVELHAGRLRVGMRPWNRRSLAHALGAGAGIAALHAEPRARPRDHARRDGASDLRLLAR